MESVTIEQARAAKTQILPHLSDLPQVNGVGLTRTEQGYAVKVNLSEPIDEEGAIPHEIDGVPVVVEVVGRIAAR